MSTLKKFSTAFVNNSVTLVPALGAALIVLSLGSVALASSVSSGAEVPTQPVVEQPVDESVQESATADIPVSDNAHLVYFRTPLEGYGLTCVLYGESLTEAERDCVATGTVSPDAISLTEAFNSAQFLEGEDMEIIQLTYGADNVGIYVPFGEEWIAE